MMVVGYPKAYPIIGGSILDCEISFPPDANLAVSSKKLLMYICQGKKKKNEIKIKILPSNLEKVLWSNKFLKVLPCKICFL